MPEISRFFGIIITMYFADHQPPYFHVRYGSQRAIVSIEDLTVFRGSLQPRVLGLVVEWAALHREELVENWRLAGLLQPVKPIDPLE